MELSDSVIGSFNFKSKENDKKKLLRKKCPYLDFLVLSFAETEIQLGNRRVKKCVFLAQHNIQ